MRRFRYVLLLIVCFATLAIPATATAQSISDGHAGFAISESPAVALPQPVAPPVFQPQPALEHSSPELLTTNSQTISRSEASRIQSLFRTTSGHPTKGYVWLSVEAVFANHSDNNDLIGDPRAPSSFSEGRFEAATTGAIEGDQVGLDTLDLNAIGQVTQDGDTSGIRLRVGYRNQLSGGLEFDGLWLQDTERSFQRGIGGINAGATPDTVRVTAALPLYDGASGYAVPFDQHYRFAITTSAQSFALNHSPQGLWWGAVLIQPTIGVRYVDFAESLAFEGADSGLSYTHNADGTPDPTTLSPPTVAFPPYQSFLNADSESMLIGPTFGLNYSTSGNLIRVSGSTRLGLFFGDASQTLSGQGLGNGFAPGFDPNVRFSDSHDESYFSPGFEQSVNLDINLYRLLPKLESFRSHGDLMLRLGWSLLAIHEVARPTSSVEWNGFPLTPTINQSREKWYVQSFNLGAVWQY